jgi:hypothetical protein
MKTIIKLVFAAMAIATAVPAGAIPTFPLAVLGALFQYKPTVNEVKEVAKAAVQVAEPAKEAVKAATQSTLTGIVHTAADYIGQFTDNYEPTSFTALGFDALRLVGCYMSYRLGKKAFRYFQSAYRKRKLANQDDEDMQNDLIRDGVCAAVLAVAIGGASLVYQPVARSK